MFTEKNLNLFFDSPASARHTAGWFALSQKQGWGKSEVSFWSTLSSSSLCGSAGLQYLAYIFVLRDYSQNYVHSASYK